MHRHMLMAQHVDLHAICMGTEDVHAPLCFRSYLQSPDEQPELRVS